MRRYMFIFFQILGKKYTTFFKKYTFFVCNLLNFLLFQKCDKLKFQAIYRIIFLYFNFSYMLLLKNLKNSHRKTIILLLQALTLNCPIEQLCYFSIHLL